MTRPILPVLFLVLSLILLNFVTPGSARPGPEDYWNKYVKEQYIPEAIKGMFRQAPAANSQGNDANKMNQSFLRNFDTRRFDAVVYHTHHNHDKFKENE